MCDCPETSDAWVPLYLVVLPARLVEPTPDAVHRISDDEDEDDDID